MWMLMKKTVVKDGFMMKILDAVEHCRVVIVFFCLVKLTRGRAFITLLAQSTSSSKDDDIHSYMSDACNAGDGQNYYSISLLSSERLMVADTAMKMVLSMKMTLTMKNMWMFAQITSSSKDDDNISHQ